MERSQRLFSALTLFALFLCCAQSSWAQADGRDPNRIRTVVLDAGHGGKDPGNLGTGRYKTTEKHISLNVAKLVGKYINETWPDVKVMYTREDDRFIELMERCNIANRAKADVFISIHCNANDSKDPHGCETYVMGLHKTEANMRVAQKENAAILLEEGHELKYDGYDPKDPESIIALSLRQNTHLDQSLLLSSLIQEQFKVRVGRPDRGVKQAGFLVISYTTMPAVLVELGFLTNAKEEDYLQGEQGQDYMASAIYRAFKEYKAIVEGVPAPNRQRSKPADSTRVEGSGEGGEAPTTGPAVRLQGADRHQQQAHRAEGEELQRHGRGGGAQGCRACTSTRWATNPRWSRRATCRRPVTAKGFDGSFIVAFKERGADRSAGSP